MVLPVCLLSMGSDYRSDVITGTIAELAARKQTYKLGMFKTLHRILMLAVLALFGFFILSSMSFSSRYDEGMS